MTGSAPDLETGSSQPSEQARASEHEGKRVPMETQGGEAASAAMTMPESSSSTTTTTMETTPSLAKSEDATMDLAAGTTETTAQTTETTETTETATEATPMTTEKEQSTEAQVPSAPGITADAEPSAEPMAVEDNSEAMTSQPRERAASEASSSSSSSSSSSEDSDDDDKRMPGANDSLETAKDKVTRFEAGEGEEAISKHGPRTANEKVPEEVSMDPLPVDDIKQDDEIELFGKVINKPDGRDALVVVSMPPEEDAEVRPVDLDSVICTKERKLVGRIEEVFGPVIKPFYLVRHMEVVGAATAENANVAASSYRVPVEDNELLFVLKRHGKYVNVAALDKRGSDASNVHDEEPDEDEIEYSDDEEEMRAKQRQRAARKAQSGNGQQSSPADGTFVIPSSAPARGGSGRRRGRDRRRDGPGEHRSGERRSGAPHGRGGSMPQGHYQHYNAHAHNQYNYQHHPQAGSYGAGAAAYGAGAGFAYGNGPAYGNNPSMGHPMQPYAQPAQAPFYAQQQQQHHHQQQQGAGFGAAFGQPQMHAPSTGGAFASVPDMMSPQQHNRQFGAAQMQTQGAPFYAQQTPYWQQQQQQGQQQSQQQQQGQQQQGPPSSRS